MSTYSMTTATYGAKVTIEVPDDPEASVRLRINTSAGETWVELSLSDVLTLRNTFAKVYADSRELACSTR